MKKVILSLIVLLMSISLFAEDTRPNILFILTDDMGYSDVGFNQVENSPVNDIVTPNIDALADNGTVFSSAYAVHMFCGPSRAGIMTGRYPHKIGSHFNLAAFSDHGIPGDETFFSDLLQDAGYYTSIIGKWHLGEEPQYRPNNRGFDHFYGFLGGGHRYFSDDWKTIAQTESAFETAAEGSFAEYSVALMRNEDFLPKPSENLYLTDMLTTEGISVIDSAKAKDQPFFLFMSYNAPHTLLEAKDADIAALKAVPYNITFSDDYRATYSAMMYALDKQIKVMIDALKAKGMYDNTLIVFMSDNGGKLNNNASANNHPLTGGKGDIEEGGVRVPMFMHWPDGMANAPAKYDHVVSGLDLYPTFVSLANGTLPAEKELDGKDIMSSVLANTDVRPDEAIFNLNVKTPNNYVLARKGKYKARTHGDGTWLLYDLEADIAEATPINDISILKELTDEAKAWAQTHSTPLWFDNPDWNWETKWTENNMPNWERTFPEDIGELPEGIVPVSLTWKDGKTDDRPIAKGGSDTLIFTYNSGVNGKAYLVADSKTGGSWGDIWYSKEVDIVQGLNVSVDVALKVPLDQGEETFVRLFMASEANATFAKRLLPHQIRYIDIVGEIVGGDKLSITNFKWDDDSNDNRELLESGTSTIKFDYENAKTTDTLYLRAASKDNWGAFWSTEMITFDDASGVKNVDFTVRAFNASNTDANRVRMMLSTNANGLWADRFDVGADSGVGNDAIYGNITASSTALKDAVAFDIVVYPNPSEGVFNFELEQAAYIVVHNLAGKVVLQRTASQGHNQVQMSQSGNYILSVKTKDAVSTVLLQVK